MEVKITIKGTEPLIMHSSYGLNPRTELAQEKAAITVKKGSNRTDADDARLAIVECLLSFWLDDAGEITIPPEAFRSCLETAARKLKQGGDVREGLMVFRSAFKYDRGKLGNTPEEVANKAQFVTTAVVQRSRVLRVRPKFDDWSVTFSVEYDEELVDRSKLERWIDIGGRRIGLGDWRPEKSGRYGRFELVSIDTD